MTLSLDGSDRDVLTNLVSKGIARLENYAARVRVADRITRDALNEVQWSIDSVVFPVLAEYEALQQMLFSNETSSKGYLVEKVLAALALRALSDLSKVERLKAQLRVLLVFPTVSMLGSCIVLQ